jgi:hypothetical protein
MMMGTVTITMRLATMALVVAGTVALRAGATADAEVFVRDIRSDGSVKVIGHFGLPVGQIITLEGKRAKRSKISNLQTLDVEKVNGKVTTFPARMGFPSYAQIENVTELPEGVPIVVKGFEALRWVGSPDTNWHVQVDFVVTEVLSPAALPFKAWER